MFVAICQINVALGLVYLGLRSWRYQTRFANAITEAIKECGCDTMDVQSQEYASLTSRDPTFSKHHHRIAKYVANIPGNDLPESWARFLSVSNTEVSRVYDWYNRGRDKVVILVTMVVSPIIFLWWRAPGATIFLALGQVAVIALIAFAWTVEKIAQKRIKNGGLYLLRRMNEASAESQAQQVAGAARPTELGGGPAGSAAYPEG